MFFFLTNDNFKQIRFFKSFSSIFLKYKKSDRKNSHQMYVFLKWLSIKAAVSRMWIISRVEIIFPRPLHSIAHLLLPHFIERNWTLFFFFLSTQSSVLPPPPLGSWTHSAIGMRRVNGEWKLPPAGAEIDSGGAGGWASGAAPPFITVSWTHSTHN